MSDVYTNPEQKPPHKREEPLKDDEGVLMWVAFLLAGFVCIGMIVSETNGQTTTPPPTGTTVDCVDLKNRINSATTSLVGLAETEAGARRAYLLWVDGMNQAQVWLAYAELHKITNPAYYQEKKEWYDYCVVQVNRFKNEWQQALSEYMSVQSTLSDLRTRYSAGGCK